MKMMFMLACILCAGALSLVIVMYSRQDLKQTSLTEPAAIREFQEWQSVVFPEQSRAVESLLEEIIAQREQLDRKELQLREREARVRQEEILLTGMRAELESLKSEWQSRFSAWDTDEETNTRKLSEFVARMDAQNAARLLGELDIMQAARILAQLQDRQAGAILDASIGTGERGIERAAKWSEAIRIGKKNLSVDSN